MILIPVGNKLVRSREFRIDDSRIVGKNFESDKEKRIKRLIKYYKKKESDGN